MRAATPHTPAIRTHAITAARTTTPRVIRSEWIKMRTLRSTWLTIGGILFALIAFGLLSALTASGQVEVTAGEGGPPAFGGTDPVSTVLSGANFAVLIVAVLGAIVGAREYSTGMIRTTLAAVPKRLPVLWGKLVTFVGVLAPVALVGVLVSFFAGMAILDAGGAATVSWSDDGVARAVIGTAVYLVGLGVIGVALGILLRSTAGGIGTVIGAVLFVPTLASALLPDSWDGVLKYLPSNAGQSFTSLNPGATLLDPGAGMAVCAAWLPLAMARAALALKRRDA
jgi:ABC-type transport system involved in multi-copper enzyme maturation permease subunit